MLLLVVSTLLLHAFSLVLPNRKSATLHGAIICYGQRSIWLRNCKDFPVCVKHLARIGNKVCCKNMFYVELCVFSRLNVRLFILHANIYVAVHTNFSFCRVYACGDAKLKGLFESFQWLRWFICF